MYKVIPQINKRVVVLIIDEKTNSYKYLCPIRIPALYILHVSIYAKYLFSNFFSRD